MPASTCFRIAIVALVPAAACSASTIMPSGSCDRPTCPGPELAWLAPPVNADGTPLLDLAGYKLHYHTTGRANNSSHSYANVVDLGMASCAALASGGTECHHNPPNLTGPAGTTYYLTVTASDHATPPNESAYSNEITMTK